MATGTPTKTPSTPEHTPAIAKAVQSGYGSEPSSYQVLLSLAKHQSIELPYDGLNNDTPGNREAMFELLRPSPQTQPNSYNLFTRDQLRAELRRRGLKPKGATLKADYIKRLTKADSETPFPFLDLPAEIRVKIYKLALQEPTKLMPTSYAPELCSQPALTKVSRAMRQETLPVFYSINTFTIFLHTPISDIAPSLCNDSAKWLAAIGKNNVNALRKFSFEIRSGWRMLVLHVDLGVRKDDAHLDVMRTCAYHEMNKPHTGCRRWRESKKLEEVRKGMKESEKEIPEEVKEWLSITHEATLKTRLTKFKVTALAATVGQMLYDMRVIID